MANRKKLNPQDLELFESIISKEPQDLTTYEIGVLISRRDYLTREEKEVFADVLVGKIFGKDAVQARKEARDVKKAKIIEEKAQKKHDEVMTKVAEAKEVAEAEKDPRFLPDEYAHSVLVQMCIDAGLDFKKNSSKQALCDLLNAR